MTLPQVKPMPDHWAIRELKVSVPPVNNDCPIIKCSHESNAVIRQIWDEMLIDFQEQFLVLFLNKSQRLIGYRFMFSGGIDKCDIDTRTIIAVSLVSLATRIIVAHNHPSGNLMPSEADLETTTFLDNRCHIMGIKLDDHLIITNSDYYSFKDNGHIK